MPEDINKNIVVVTILDIKKILDNTIASQGLDKISDGGLPIGAKDLFIDISETSFVGHLLKVADGFGIVDKLDEAGVRTVGDYGVGFHPYFYILLLEYFVDEGY